METNLRIIDEVDSTNITLAELAAKGALEGTCVVSFYQRHGQGRSGRTFFSPDGGNLYMSLLLRPDEANTDMITVAAASATVGAIKSVFSIDTGIKWVNDIYLNDKKVCGIIAQAHNFGTSDFYVILGIGINIYKSQNVPEDITGIYGSLFDRTCDLSKDEQRSDAIRLAKEIIDRFALYYEHPDDIGYIRDYRNSSIVIGRDVEYVFADKVINAKVVDIADDGSIVLDTGDEEKSYRDGEIRISLK